MNKLPPKGRDYLIDIIDVDFTVSFVTHIEYLGFKNVSLVAEQFIKLANVIEIDKHIIDTCIELRKNQSIKLPDAIIASTALARELILLTRNTADFSQISELKVVNLWEIA